MSRFARAALLALGALAFLDHARADDTANASGAGYDKTRMCAGCHGIPEYRTAFPQVYSVPRLGGQDPGYITSALQGYRAGSRKHPAMEGVAASLSDQDIADIAAFYAATQPQAHGKLDASGRKKADEACAACHGKEDGKPTFPGAPRLAGQQYDYVVHALQAFRSGARASPIMGTIAKPLSDEDIRVLARYYSSVPGLSTKY